MLNKILGLNILRVNSLDEVTKDNLAKIDLVEVLQKATSGFWRPEKITWRMEIGPEPILSQIRSAKARKQIRHDEKKLASLGIELKTITEIDQSTFTWWLRLYREQIGGKEKGMVLIDESWLNKKHQEGKRIGAVLAFKGEKLLGGDLFYPKGDRLVVAYGVAEHLAELYGGLMLLVDCFAFSYAQSLGFNEISLGQDTNLYGYHLSPGLMFYKAKLGFKPYPAKNAAWVTTFFPDFSKFSDPVIFFAGDEKALSLIVLSGQKTPALPCLPKGLNSVEVLDKGITQQEHLSFLTA